MGIDPSVVGERSPTSRAHAINYFCTISAVLWCWRPVGDGVTQHHKLLISCDFIRLLLLNIVADRGSSFHSAIAEALQVTLSPVAKQQPP